MSRTILAGLAVLCLSLMLTTESSRAQALEFGMSPAKAIAKIHQRGLASDTLLEGPGKLWINVVRFAPYRMGGYEGILSVEFNREGQLISYRWDREAPAIDGRNERMKKAIATVKANATEDDLKKFLDNLAKTRGKYDKMESRSGMIYAWEDPKTHRNIDAVYMRMGGIHYTKVNPGAH